MEIHIEVKDAFRGGIAAALLIAVAGCSGGGGGSDSSAPLRPAELAGSWNGSATDTGTGEVLTATAFIDESGEAQLIVLPALTLGPGAAVPTIPRELLVSSTDRDSAYLPIAAIGGVVFTAAQIFVVHGNVCCTSDLRGMLTAESMSSGAKSSTQVTGSLKDGMLVGTFTFDGKPYSFTLARSATYNETLSMQDLGGVYSIAPPAFLGSQSITYTITVAANGTVTGTHVNGCIYNGSVSIPNTAHNLFRLSIQLTNCGSSSFGPRNGDYTGLGALLRNVLSLDGQGGTRQVFYYSLIGPVWLGTQGLRK